MDEMSFNEAKDKLKKALEEFRKACASDQQFEAETHKLESEVQPFAKQRRNW